MKSTTKFPRRRQRGMALIASIGMLFTVAFLGVALMAQAVSSTRLSGHRRNETAAFNLAEAGIYQGRECLIENSYYTGENNTALGSGSFTVSVSTPTGKYWQRLIQSVSSVREVTGNNANGRVTALVDTSVTPTVFNYSILTKDPLSMSGQLSTSSGDTPPWIGAGTQTHRGDVHSNSTSLLAINISGTPTIDGRVSTVGGFSVGSTGISVQNAAPAVPFPTLDTAYLKQSIQSTYGSMTAQSVSGGTLHVQGVINGNLTSSGQATVSIDGPLYVTGNINLSGGGGFIYNTTNPLIIADGSIAISGNTVLSSTSAPYPNAMIATLSNSGSAVTISGGAQVVGSIFAPNGTTSLAGGSQLFGSIATKGYSQSGGAIVRRNTSYVTPPAFTGAAKILYWQER